MTHEMTQNDIKGGLPSCLSVCFVFFGLLDSTYFLHCFAYIRSARVSSTNIIYDFGFVFEGRARETTRFGLNV